MRLIRIALTACLGLALASSLAAQQPPQQQQPRKKKVLFIGQCKGFHHDSVSHTAGTIWKVGQESGLWDTYIKSDTQLVTKQRLGNNAKNLNFFDVVVFYTSGELDMDEQQKADLLSFVKEDGKGFLAIHSGNDTFYKWPEYGELVGGYFDFHPWNTFDAPLVVEDPAFPGMSALPKEFVMKDEIYQIKDYSREKVRVLLRLDDSKLDLTKRMVHRTDKDFAVIWAKNYGKGRSMFNGLGHVEAVWDRPDIQKMLLEHFKWLMGMVPGDATPRPRP